MKTVGELINELEKWPKSSLVFMSEGVHYFGEFKVEATDCGPCLTHEQCEVCCDEEVEE